MSTETKNSFKTAKRLFISALMLGVISLVAMGVMNTNKQETVSADTPTFYFSTSVGCGGVLPSATLNPANNPNTLYLCVNGENEGAGLLGAEVHVSYPTNLIGNVSTYCSAFDTCIDLSETGTIKLLAASGPVTEGGHPVTSKKALASISMNLLAEGTANLSFSASQIINENQDVESRSATGIAISISGELLPGCGNNAIDTGEQCDGAKLNGASCESLGYDSGTLACTAGCVFNTSGCKYEEEPLPANCGNGTADAGEDCDGSSLSGQTCTSQGYSGGGTLKCDGSCNFDYTSCAGICDNNNCGNGVKECGEQCDDNNRDPGDGCDPSCQLEAELPPTGSDLVSCTISPHFGATSAVSGASVEFLAEAEFANGSTVNITSCFPCPTHGEPDRKGTLSYSASGASYFSSNYLVVNGNPGDDVYVSASYYDGFSHITKSCNTVRISVAAAPSVYCGDGSCNGDETAETCPDDCAEEVRPAAPEEEAIAEAEAIADQGETLIAVGLQAPDQPELDRCLEYDNAVDTDSDGLSDRTECYLMTNPNNPDTDGDGCWDGDEINQFSTNPLIGTDCSIEEKIQEGVVITDPQPGWVIPSVRVAGIAPRNTNSVSASVIPAENKKLKVVINKLDALLEGSTAEEIEMELGDLEAAVNDMYSFISMYPEYDYADIVTAMDSLICKINGCETITGIRQMTYLSQKENAITEYFSASPGWIQTELLDKRPTRYLGSTSEFGDTAVGSGQLAKSFHLNPDVVEPPLIDKKAYDVVAVAKVSGGSKTSSPVRFSVDSTISVGKPNPRSIGGEGIPTGAIAMGNIFINGVLAEDGAEIEVEIDDEKPTVSGDSEYGAQVFAVWESIVLASSVISDSEQGAFDIQAPRNLEANTGHKVTLYAVKADDESGDRMRSEDVNVYFRIKSEAFPLGLFLWVIGITAALVALIFVLRKRLRKKEEEGKKEMAEEIAEAEKEFEKDMPEVISAAPQAPKPVEEKVEKPAEKPAKEPVEEKVEKPAEKPAKEPVEEKVEAIERPMEQQVEQPAVQAYTEPTPEEHAEKEAELKEAFTKKAKKTHSKHAKQAEVHYESPELEELKERLIEAEEEILEYAEHEAEEAEKKLEEAKKKLVADRKL